MRGLWRTIAYMAEDQNGFNEALSAVSDTVETNLLDDLKMSNQPNENRTFFLKKQPTWSILREVERVLREQRAVSGLCAYELGEVNRLCCDAKSKNPPFGSFKAYWNGLGKIAPANRKKAPFMEAVGSLAFDSNARRNFVNGMSLKPWFDLTEKQQTGLREAMRTGSPADIAANDFFDEFWPGSVCGALLSPSDDWTHVNL